MNRAMPWIAGILIQCSLTGMLFLGDLRQHAFLLLFAVAVLGYFLGVRYCGWIGWKGVVLAALLFRATLFITSPTLSEDIYRYVWDGRVQSSGINPYRFQPNAEQLNHLRDEGVFSRVNHREVSTIYPPLAQAVFLVCYKILPSPWTFKVAFILAELMLSWFLLGLIRLYDQHPGQLLIFLWNPLQILEVAGSGHVDILGIMFLIVALLYVQIGGYGRAFGALALSFLCKFFAICLLPVFWRWMCDRQNNEETPGSRIRMMLKPATAWPVLVFFIVVGAGYWPYLDAGEGLYRGALIYAEHWEFNSPVFDLSRGLLGGTFARILIALVFCTTVVLLTLGRMPPVQAGYYLAGLFIWLSPTLHPWYVLWILPFLVFYRSAGWMVFSGLIVSAYVVSIRYAVDGLWIEVPWVKAIPFAGFLTTWFWFEWKARRSGNIPVSRH